MIIDQEVAGTRTRLVQASATRVVDRDEYSVTVETSGLTDAGDPISFRLVISGNELMLMLARPTT